jgi:hypothetical protein
MEELSTGVLKLEEKRNYLSKTCVRCRRTSGPRHTVHSGLVEENLVGKEETMMENSKAVPDVRDASFWLPEYFSPRSSLYAIATHQESGQLFPRFVGFASRR